MTSTSGISSSPGSTSVNLIDRVRSGNESAWFRLVEIYGPLVYAHCRRAGLSEHDARDAVQEVFRSVHSAIDDFDYDRPGASFRAWLRTIASRRVADSFRAAGREPLPSPHADDVASEIETGTWRSDHEADPVTQLVVRRAIQRIQIDYEPNTWQAFWRTAVLDEPAAEVAADLNTTPHAVRQAKYKIIKRLRHELREFFEEE